LPYVGRVPFTNAAKNELLRALGEPELPTQPVAEPAPAATRPQRPLSRHVVPSARIYVMGLMVALGLYTAGVLLLASGALTSTLRVRAIAVALGAAGGVATLAGLTLRRPVRRIYMSATFFPFPDEVAWFAELVDRHGAETVRAAFYRVGMWEFFEPMLQGIEMRRKVEELGVLEERRQRIADSRSERRARLAAERSIRQDTDNAVADLIESVRPRVWTWMGITAIV
ncbi:MAG: hypothetical protein JWL83_4574, partial [Actinomycetia bacterium]|nr:hypothetical protein [Actinomycetes bacterium]